MADNLTLNAGAGGSTLATDDIAGVHYQIVKLIIGALDAGTLLDGNSGNKSAGTLRVVLATDQPALTNKLLTTPDLPSGASTAANQSTEITSLQLIDDVVLVEDAAHSSGDKGVMLLAVREATATDLSAGNTDGDYEPLEVDASGRLWVNAGAVTPGTAAANLGKAEDAAHSSGDTGVMLLAVRESTATDLSAGATNGDYEPLQVDASGQLWVNVGSFTPGTAAGSLGKAEDAAHSSGDTGVMILGVRAAAPTDRSAGPTDGDYEPIGLNEVGAVWVSPTGSANGGLSTFMASGSDGSSILVATAQAIKASAGTMYGYFAYNPEAAVSFVHFYNTAAASVTVGTTNPLFTIQVPAGSAANLSIPQGIAFSNAGWSCAATTTAGGNTAPATGVSLTVWYK